MFDYIFCLFFVISSFSVFSLYSFKFSGINASLSQGLIESLSDNSISDELVVAGCYFTPIFSS